MTDFTTISKNDINFLVDSNESFYLLKYLKCAYFESNVTYHYKIRSNSIVSSSSRKTKAQSFKIIYHTIITNLTPGYEKEELKYYSPKIGYAYVRDVKEEPEFKYIIDKCREYSKQYGGGMSNFSYYLYLGLGRFNKGWLVLALYLRIRQPSVLLRDINRFSGCALKRERRKNVG